MITQDSQELAVLTDVDFDRFGDSFRAVLSVGHGVHFRKGELSNPDRLYVDLLDTIVSPKLLNSPIETGTETVRRIRIGQNQVNVARIVFDLTGPVSNQVFFLEDPWRVVVEMRLVSSPGRNLVRLGEQALEAPGTLVVRGVSFTTHAQNTEVNLELSRKVRIQPSRLSNPERLYFDLPRASIGENLKAREFNVGDDFLHRIRIGEPQPGVIRLVLDLKSRIEYRLIELDQGKKLTLLIGSELVDRTPGSFVRELEPAEPPDTIVRSEPVFPSESPAPELQSDLIKWVDLSKRVRPAAELFDALKPASIPPAISQPGLDDEAVKVRLDRTDKSEPPAVVVSESLGAPDTAEAPLSDVEDPSVLLDEIVAKVNSEFITSSDLNREIGLMRGELAQKTTDSMSLNRELERRRRLLLKELITRKLLVLKAEEMQVWTEVDTQVEAFLQQVYREGGLKGEAELNWILQEWGVTYEEYRRVVRERILANAVIQSMVLPRLSISESEIYTFYQDHLSEYMVPSQVEIAEIFLEKYGKPEEEVRRKALDALERIRSGTPFEEVAVVVSEGPTADKGGRLGVFERGSMNENIEDIVFSLDEREVSELIETEDGFQIFTVVSKTDDSPIPFKEVSARIRARIEEEKFDTAVEKFLKDLTEEAYIHVSPKFRPYFDLPFE